MIIHYDPILGCTGWTIPKRELSKEERYKRIYNFLNGKHTGKPLNTFLTRLPKEDKKGKKQKTYEWQLKQQANE
jgi:hypothetical protein